VLLKILIGLLAGFGLIVVAAYLGQRRLQYFPDPRRIEPAAAGLHGVREVVIKAPDGAEIVNWWGKARDEQPTLLYFHGNGGSLAERAPRIARSMDEGWGVFMMAYRGYSGSTGSPTEADNVADALRAFDYLIAYGVPASHILLYGESLGTGVAAQVAAARPAAGLILDAPYTSAVAVGLLRYPFLPIRQGMSDRYETDKVIGRVHMPLLILHGVRDPVIPVAMGREVLRLANEPKMMIEIPNGGHGDLYINGNDGFRPLKAWIAALPR
jgi:fermentation-respiration switch protein FrsA (DUF1100 family)